MKKRLNDLERRRPAQPVKNWLMIEETTDGRWWLCDEGKTREATAEERKQLESQPYLIVVCVARPGEAP